MPTIQFMNINGQDYDLYSSGISYLAGEGIIIDANGIIKVNPDYVSPSTKALIAGNSEQISLLQVGLDGITAVVNNVDTDLGTLQTVVNVMPGQITTNLERLIDSEGARLEHLISEGYNGTYDRITQWVDSQGYVGMNELIRTTSEMISRLTVSEGDLTELRSEIAQSASDITAYVEELDSENNRKFSELALTTSEVSISVADLSKELSNRITTTANSLDIALNGPDGLLRGVNITADGVKISNHDFDKNYVLIDQSGISIYVNKKKVAEGTSGIFECDNGLGVQSWVMEQKSGAPTTLNIHRRIRN